MYTPHDEYPSLFFEACSTRFGKKKIKFWQLFAISSSWYQMEITINWVRIVISLDLNRFLITAHKFFMRFKSGEFPIQEP